MFPAGFSFCRKCCIINTFNANKGTKIVHFTSTDPQNLDLNQLFYKEKNGEPHGKMVFLHPKSAYQKVTPAGQPYCHSGQF